jgi:hypothetical protein
VNEFWNLAPSSFGLPEVYSNGVKMASASEQLSASDTEQRYDAKEE